MTEADTIVRPIAERLGTYVAGLVHAPLDPPVVEKAVSCLLDAVGIALGTRDDRTCGAFRSTVMRSPQGPGTARLWHDGTSAALPDAIAANAMAVHAYMQDDVDMAAWSHPGSLIVPVAVGLGEAHSSSLDATVRSIVSGYSVLHWLGTGIGRGMLDRGFRTSPTYGTVAAAAAAATALSLPARLAAQALATAASVAGAVTGTPRAGFADWRFQNASAGWLGVSAARLAAAGGTDDNPDIFEGPNGFLAKFAAFEPPTTLPGQPSPDMILSTWFHPHPLGLEMGIQNVAATSAAWKLRQEHRLVVADIIRVRVHQNAEFAAPAGSSFAGPFDWPKQAFGSTKFAVATTLAHGKLRQFQYLHERDDPEVMALIPLVEIVPNDTFSFLEARVEVELSSGRSLVADASELSSSLFHRDRDASSGVLDSILTELGRSPGSGRELSDSLFEDAARGGHREMRDVLDDLLGSELSPVPANSNHPGRYSA